MAGPRALPRIPALGLVSGGPLPRVRQPALAGDSSQPASQVLSVRGLGRVVGTLLTHPRSLWVRTRGPPSSHQPHTHRLRDAEADAGHPRDKALKATGRGLRKLGAGCGVQPLGGQRIFRDLVSLKTSLREARSPVSTSENRTWFRSSGFLAGILQLISSGKSSAGPYPWAHACVCVHVRVVQDPGLVLNLLVL